MQGLETDGPVCEECDSEDVTTNTVIDPTTYVCNGCGHTWPIPDNLEDEDDEGDDEKEDEYDEDEDEDEDWDDDWDEDGEDEFADSDPD